MYTPEHFREDRPEVLGDLMRTHPFAAIVTAGQSGLEASHIPVICTGETIEGHFSLANDHWRSADGAGALAIFQGPQAYISPNWYPTKHEHGRAVPTWNYCVVHARGKLTLRREPEWLRAMLEKLTSANEAWQP